MKLIRAGWANRGVRANWSHGLQTKKDVREAAHTKTTLARKSQEETGTFSVKSVLQKHETG